MCGHETGGGGWSKTGGLVLPGPGLKPPLLRPYSAQGLGRFSVKLNRDLIGSNLKQDNCKETSHVMKQNAPSRLNRF